ncbi:MAG: sulfate transporter [marine bacterium B5-7]|nr:MAG: sulfate transporter [marine bacterium B5-7]
MVPAIIAALFGSSWHLVSGPTTAASIVMFSALSSFAEPGTMPYVSLAITLTFMVGVIQLSMGLFRLGSLVNFISHSVIVGFTAGAAVLIATKQAKNFFGMEIPSGGHVHDIVYHVSQHLPEVQPLVFSVAVMTVVAGTLSKRFIPRVPYMIVALVAGSIFAVVLNKIFGQEVTGIEMVGALPRSLPPLSAPEFSISVFKELAPAALAMTLFALTEAVSIARSISLRSGQAIEGNQEFIGQGLSNLVGSFFSAYVATGSFNRSGANYDMGARTPLSAVFAGLLLVVIVLVIAPATAYLPKAAMAGLLFMVAWRLIDFQQIRTILRASRPESAVMILTFLSALFLDLEFAILLGVMLSLMFYLSRTSKPRILPRVPDPGSANRKFTTSMKLPECPQLKIIRIDDSLYFGAVAYVRQILKKIYEHYPDQKHLLLLAQGINQVDVAGAELLIEEVRSRRSVDGDVWLYQLKDTAADVLDNCGYLDEIGKDHMFMWKGEAISTIFKHLDPSVCQVCEKRIFNECAKYAPKDSPESS